MNDYRSSFGTMVPNDERCIVQRCVASLNDARYIVHGSGTMNDARCIVHRSERCRTMRYEGGGRGVRHLLLVRPISPSSHALSSYPSLLRTAAWLHPSLQQPIRVFTPPTNEPTNQQTNRPTKQINRPAHEPTYKAATQLNKNIATHSPTTQPQKQSKRPTNKTTKRSTNYPADDHKSVSGLPDQQSIVSIIESAPCWHSVR